MKTGHRGQVLVLVAIALFALLGFAALAVDVGYMYTVRHELQRCADAGALAGASFFKEGGTWSPALDPVTSPPAVRARDYASRDMVGTSRLDPAVGEVEVAFSPPLLDNQIRVTVHRNVTLFFAPIFGMGNTTIGASAVARAYYRAGPPPDNSVQLVE
jgi:uncharacterized membrane protein